jgi:signal peptidase I
MMILECKKNCHIALDYRPCRKQTDKTVTEGNLSLFDGRLVHKSLEIGKAIAEKGKLTMKATGTCMYPNVRHGDSLLIAPANSVEINVGDIAICRKPAYLFAHRVVGKGRDDDGRPCIITRADRNRFSDDGKTYDENILGRVKRIERKGGQVPILPEKHFLPVHLFHEAHLSLNNLSWQSKARLREILMPVQGSPAYRLLGKIWWRVNVGRAEYSIRIPLHPERKTTFFKKVEISEFDRSYVDLEGASKVDVFVLDLKFKGSRQPACSLSLTRSPEGCVKQGWWIDDKTIRFRYRGTGIEEAIIEKATGIIGEYGQALHCIN